MGLTGLDVVDQGYRLEEHINRCIPLLQESILGSLSSQRFQVKRSVMPLTKLQVIIFNQLHGIAITQFDWLGFS
jgi:hypothetical protein